MQKKKTLSCLQDNVFLIVFQWPLQLGVSSTLLPCFRARTTHTIRNGTGADWRYGKESNGQKGATGQGNR